MYKLRIDIPNNKREDVVKLCCKYTSLWIVSYEGGTNNPHCHLYIHLLCKQATIRNRIRKDFGGGNGSYSLKEVDEEYPMEYLAYLVKEGDYVHSDNFPQDKLSSALVYDLRKKKQMKDAKSNRLPVWKKILEECKDIEYNNDTRQEISKRIVAYHYKNEILIRRFALKSYLDTIYLKLFPQFATYDLVRWLCDN